MSNDDRYEAVLASIGRAMAEAGELGWQGHEREAHVFLAMLDAAQGNETQPAPAPEPEAPQAPVEVEQPVEETERSESEKGSG